MAIDNTVALWNENAGSVYNAREYRRWLEKMLAFDVVASPGTAAGGVFRGGDLLVSAGGGQSVNVAIGACYVDGSESSTQGGYFVYNDAVTNVAVTAADGTNPRIDLIGVQIRDSEYSTAFNDARILVVTGTPAGSPSAPTAPANFLTLAQISVPANDNTVDAGQITDRRQRVAALGGIVVCTSTTRPSVNLFEGLFIYETDTDALKQYTTGTTLWTPPWNLSWGYVVAPASSTSGSGATAAGTPIDGVSSNTTPTLVANRRMRYWWQTHILSNGVGGDNIRLTITDGSNVVKNSRDWTSAMQNIATAADCTSFETSTAAVVTRKGRVQRTTASGNVGTFADATRPQWFFAEDMGPAGAPS